MGRSVAAARVGAGRGGAKGNVEIGVGTAVCVSVCDIESENQ